MLRVRAIIRVVPVLGWAVVACLFALAVAAAAPAQAKDAARSAPEVAAPAVIAAPAKSYSGTARFFRIQDVVDSADGRPNDGRLASLGDTLSDAPALRGSIPLVGEEPFGLFAFRAPEGVLWQKWRGLQNGFDAELALVERCRDDEAACTPAARHFIKALDAVKTREGRAQLDDVNRAVNAAIRYQNDEAQFGESDRWLTPLAAFTSGRGDCEDYAIAKYFLLREAGYPLIDLRLLLVRDNAVRDDHAVLAARHDNRWLILDNRHATLHADTSLPHFTPLFAINHDGVKLVAAPYRKRAVVAEAAPAPWLEGEEFSLRGAIAVEPASGASGVIEAPLLL